MWGTLELLDRQIGRDERPEAPGLERERWAEQFRQFIRMLDKIPDPELCRPKPRIRVKAGSRWVPPGYKPPTQALREAYAAYREVFGE